MHTCTHAHMYTCTHAHMPALLHVQLLFAGASGAIYRFLGINRSRTFPYEVRAAVQHESDAGYKKYVSNNLMTHNIHFVFR